MNNIKELLERYYNGDTTLEEEKGISDYLAANPEEAEAADRLFFADLHELKSGALKPAQKKTRRIAWRYLSIGGTSLAAGIALLIGLRQQTTPQQNQPAAIHTISTQLLVKPGVSGEITNEEQALEQARKALAFVSNKLNKGTAGIGRLNQLEKSISTIQNKEEL